MRQDLIGETLLNQFRVESFLAAGGMATIYRVWDVQRMVPLAMKVLHPELAADPAFIARFEREAQSLQMLVHPHIVPFYGLYRAGDITFLLERYIDGPSLDEVLRKRGGSPLPIRDVLVLFKSLYTSLGYAHAQGIVHCDVKPGNVLIDQGGHAYLTDFGIARFMDSSVTTSSALGTPLYMSPEQIRGERLYPESDIYSLGVLLYELATGQRPFRGDIDVPGGASNTPSDRIRYQHLTQLPQNPRALRPDLPEGVARVIMRAMAKDPRERYKNVQEMAVEIEQAVGARMDTLPDRVRLLEGAAPAYDGTIPLRPNEAVGSDPDAWPWNNPPPGAYTPPPSGQYQPPPQTLPGPPPDNYTFDSASVQPVKIPRRGGMERWLALITALVLMGVCVVFGVRAARGLGLLPGMPTVDPNAVATSVAAAVTNTAVATLTPEATRNAAATEMFAITQTAEAIGATQTAEAAAATGTAEVEATDTAATQTASVTERPPMGFPGGGQIAIVQRQGGVDRLNLLDAANGTASVIPLVPNVEPDLSHAPQWSPDGRRLTWMSRYDGRMHIVVMDMDEQEPYQLPSAENYPNVSSPAWVDNNRVSFYASSNAAGWVVIADGSTGEELDRTELDFYRNLFVWNTLGQVAFVQQMNGVYEVAIAGSARGTDYRPDSGGEEYAPAWSPDGGWVAFQSDAQREPGMNEIWISRDDGAEMRRVTNSPEGTWSRAPTWSPDGRFIAYVSDRSGSIGADFGELFIVEVATSEVRQITQTGGAVYDWRPAWRP